MINWEIIERWRDELRSGKHKQGKYTLKNFNGEMCCLGVLESEVMKTPVNGKTGGILPNFTFGQDKKSAELTTQTTITTGLIKSTIFGTPFYILNDRDNLTFDEIADLIDVALIEREGIE